MRKRSTYIPRGMSAEVTIVVILTLAAIVLAGLAVLALRVIAS